MGKLENMLLGIAIGDAFGAGYEFLFKELDKFKENLDFTRYQTSEFHSQGGHVPGMYTDDTQMSIAIAEVLLNQDSITRENLAKSFIESYKRDPIQGYAKGFKGLLESTVSVEDFLEKIAPHAPNTLANGAAMRAVPLGILSNVDDVVNAAITNAQITHNNSKGEASSTTVALLSHYNLYEGSISKFATEGIPIVSEIDSETGEHLSKIYEHSKQAKTPTNLFLFGEKYENRGLPCHGMLTVGLVYNLLLKHSEPSSLLKDAICMGGDTDSTAAISLGINLTNNNVTDLPEFLYDNLRNHQFGRDYIVKLGNALEKKYFSQTPN